jgi:murein DD-endopeptidase MepM/ murein hydrolase activator NlpD
MRKRWWYVHCSDSKFHTGWQQHAVDFLMSDGTPVAAADDGIIIEVCEDHDTWGLANSNSRYLNFVTVRHGNGEHTLYAHLKKGSVSARDLSVGSTVKRGQVIATVGKTGCVGQDQLHFCVFVSLPNGSTTNGLGVKSLIPRFAKYGYL